MAFAALISFGQSFLQACDGPFPRDAGNTYCDPTTRGRPASKFKASSVIGLEERPVLVSLRCRRAAAKSISVHFKARISSRRAPVSAHSLISAADFQSASPEASSSDRAWPRRAQWR